MRTKKALINFLFNLLQQFVNVITNLVVPMLFIGTYGSVINGLNASVKQSFSYLNIVESGVAMSATQALYKPIVDRDTERVNGILSATRMFYTRSGMLFAALVGAFALLYPLFIHDDVPKSFIYSIVLILGITGIVEYLIAGKYRVLLCADQKSYVVSIGQIAGYSINTIICVILVWLGQGFLVVQALSTFAYVIVRLGILIYFVTKHYPSYRFDSLPDSKSISTRWDSLIHQITGLVVTNTPFVLLTLFGSLKDVSIYSVYFLIFGGVTVLVSTFSSGLASGFGEVLAKNDREALHRGYNDFEFIYCIAMSFIYTCTIILILPFISLYTRNVHDANYVDLIIALQFTFIGLSNNIRVPTMTLVVAAGHFKETRWRAVMEAAINILVSTIFTYFWGIYGVLMGSICSYTYRTIDFIIYGNRHILYKSPIKSIIRISRNILLGLLISTPFVLVQTIHFSSWMSWVGYAIVVCIIVSLVVVGGNALFEYKQMKAIFERIMSLFSGLTLNRLRKQSG
jgi:O-antigen/teichoic acid export membrane protein